MIQKFKVTDKEIKTGIRASHNSCPVALTLRENGYPKALVGTSNIELSPVKTISMPSELIKWIDDFDSDKEVQPIEFELDI